MKINKPLRRLPLSGTQNTRDIGGYPCIGGATRWGVFVRSDNPGTLTKKDLEYLVAYGIRDVVDLRREDETIRMPSSLCNVKGFDVHHISVNEMTQGLDFEGDVPGSMAGLYISILDHSQPEVAKVMRVCIAAKGGVLFHCMVGKDRTGVVAMLLMQLAGVAEADIVADYAVTDVFMREVFDQQLNELDKSKREEIEYRIRSKPASMWRTLRHLQDVYGGAEAYLLKAGLAQSDIEALRAKFVQKA